MYASILKKVWSDYYSSKVPFVGSKHLVFRSHLMESPRNDKVIDTTRTLDDV